MTGTEKVNQGTLNVDLDIGNGFETQVTSADIWAPGSTVLDACFTSVLAVRVHNPSSEGWAGTVTVSSDGGSTYRALSCVSCTAGTGTAQLVVDGDGNAVDQAAAACLNGAACTLAVPPLSPPLLPRIAARMSSQYDANCGPQNCIDGNVSHLSWCTPGSTLCHTGVTEADETDPWLEIDLGSEYEVGSVEIYNRIDCCQERLGSYEVWLGSKTSARLTRCAANVAPS